MAKLTEEQQQKEKKHLGVDQLYELHIKYQGRDLYSYLTEPSRTELGIFMSMLTSSPFDAYSALFSACITKEMGTVNPADYNDIEMWSNHMIFFHVWPEMSAIFGDYQATLKKL